MSSPTPLRILALDGGGIRGVLNARLLAHLERELQYASQDLFDLFAGTSTGALILAGLAVPIGEGHHRERAQDFVDMYRSAALDIFPRRRTVPRLIAGLPKRPPANPALEQVLATYVGATTLADTAVDVAIPAYDLANREVVVFTQRDEASSQTRLADAARASAAAPTYFPPVKLRWQGRDRELVDGGLFANNPALIAALQAWRRTPDRPLHVCPWALA